MQIFGHLKFSIHLELFVPTATTLPMMLLKEILLFIKFKLGSATALSTKVPLFVLIFIQVLATICSANSTDGRVIKMSVFGAVYSGLIPSQVKPMT